MYVYRNWTSLFTSNVCGIVRLRGQKHLWSLIFCGRENILLLGEAQKFRVNSHKFAKN